MSGSIAPVSVVLPCYRCAATFERALHSVANQSARSAEVLIIDDGSDDTTLVVVNAIVSSYPAGWIRVIALKQNQGPANARNVGWNAARYPFVAFLDADDAWHPRKIEIQYDFMATHADVAICGHRHYVTNQKGTELAAVKVQIGQVKVISKAAMLLSNRFITPSVMVRRDMQLRFEDGRRHMEDHLLWMRAACADYRVVRLETPLAWIFKAPYGSGGLSSELWAMELGSLRNYMSLRRDQCIGWIACVFLMGYSLAKYFRRLVIVAMPRLWAVVRRAGKNIYGARTP